MAVVDIAAAQQPTNTPELFSEEEISRYRSQSSAQIASLDDFTQDCIKSYIDNGTKLSSFGCYGYAHLTTSQEATNYYGGFEIADVVALSLGEDNTTLYTELLSDNLFLSSRFGYARIGLGALVGAAEDSTATTVQQFFESGGNGTAYLTKPIFRWVNLVPVDQTRVNVTALRRADIGMTLAIRGDVPALNAAVENPSFNTYAGLRLQGTQNTAANRLRLFFGVEGGWVWSPDDEFYQNLGVPTSPRLGFLMTKLTGGVDLNSLIRVGVSTGTSTLDQVTLSPRISVQLLPN